MNFPTASFRSLVGVCSPVRNSNYILLLSLKSASKISIILSHRGLCVTGLCYLMYSRYTERNNEVQKTLKCQFFFPFFCFRFHMGIICNGLGLLHVCCMSFLMFDSIQVNDEEKNWQHRNDEGTKENEQHERF